MENKDHAGFFIRALAFVIDLNLLVFPLYFLGLLFYLFIGPSGISALNIYAAMFIEISFLLFIAFDYFILTTYFLGGTVGKLLLELKVTSKDFSKVRLSQIIIRETIGRLVSAVLFLGYLAVFFTQDKTGFHDKLAGTIVLRDNPSQKHESLLIFLILLVILIIAIAIPAFLMFSIMQILRIPGDYPAIPIPIN